MRTIVIYNSQTGFTKRYAEWIAEAIGADCVPFAEAKKKDMARYDTIIFGSWLCAGTIKNLGWFQKNADRWTGKKVMVFCTGASPVENPVTEAAFKQITDEPKMKKVKTFYCPAGLNYDKMGAVSRLMMKTLFKALKAKKKKTQEDEEMINMISSSYDIADQKYIEPILTYLRG